MKRSKENVIYWEKRIDKLFDLDPKYKSVKSRYDSLKLLLQEKYPHIKDHDNIQMLKDVVYLDRKLRLLTEDEEKEEKQILEEEYLLENGYEVGYNKDIKTLQKLC
jgi:hypothetical protein